MKKFPKLVFSDFDGTLTKQGKFSPAFFDVLELIKTNESDLIIVTGRPLSWAHFLITHFDLDTVITEGGGMISNRIKESRFEDIPLVTKDAINHLEQTTKELLKHFNGIQLSEDSSCRISDRAIDLGFLKNFDRDSEIENFFSDRKINFSRSNVHLNFWAGQISKKLSIEYFLAKKNVDQNDCLFFGDSLNDESAFEFFNNSVGVSNIKEVQDKLVSPPKVILEGKENEEILGVLNYLSTLS